MNQRIAMDAMGCEDREDNRFESLWKRPQAIRAVDDHERLPAVIISVARDPYRGQGIGVLARG